MVQPEFNTKFPVSRNGTPPCPLHSVSLLKSTWTGTGCLTHNFLIQCYYHIYTFGFYPKECEGPYLIELWDCSFAPRPLPLPKSRMRSVPLPCPSIICICIFLPKTERSSKAGQPTLVSTLHTHGQHEMLSISRELKRFDHLKSSNISKGNSVEMADNSL